MPRIGRYENPCLPVGSHPYLTPGDRDGLPPPGGEGGRDVAIATVASSLREKGF